MSTFQDRLKRLDTHSTVSKEFRVYTLYGAVLSMITVFGTFLCECHRLVLFRSDFLDIDLTKFHLITHNVLVLLSSRATTH